MKACYAIQRTYAVLLFCISTSTTENTLGYLSVRNPVFEGGDIKLMFIPFYQAFVRDFHDLKLQVKLKHNTSQQKIDGALRPFDNGKAVFMEISNVNKTWNNSAVYLTYKNKESNRVDLQIQDRTEGFLHVLSLPLPAWKHCTNCILSPVGFQDFTATRQWWLNLNGGNVDDENKEEIIYTININYSRIFFLEYMYKNSLMKINVTLVFAQKAIFPPCTYQECDHCVCVHTGGDVTCSTDGHMLAMWIDYENVEYAQRLDTGNAVKQYQPHNFSITKQHHNSTIVCFMEKNGVVFNDSATLIVLDAEQSIVSQDSSTTLTYTLVFTSVFIVAVAVSCILVKRLNRSNMRLLGCCRAGRRVAKRAQDIDQEDNLSAQEEVTATIEHHYDEIEEEHGAAKALTQPTIIHNQIAHANIHVSATIEQHYEDIEDDLGATTSLTQQRIVNEQLTPNERPHRDLMRLRHQEDVVRLETSEQLFELNPTALLANPAAYEPLKRPDSDPGHKYTSLRPRCTSSLEANYVNII